MAPHKPPEVVVLYIYLFLLVGKNMFKSQQIPQLNYNGNFGYCICNMYWVDNVTLFE